MVVVAKDGARVDWPKERRAATADVISACDSPAEASLLVALYAHDAFGPMGSGAPWTVVVQHQVVLPTRCARLDVALFNSPAQVAVEVDGWAYHHASFEQEARDAERQRGLEAIGWHVIRVPAWRALEQPRACVSDIVERLELAHIRAMVAAGTHDPLPAMLSDIEAAVVAGDTVAEQDGRFRLGLHLVKSCLGRCFGEGER